MYNKVLNLKLTAYSLAQWWRKALALHVRRTNFSSSKL